MRYIKIAAMLPNRTIRDVALRCWWSTVKSLLSDVLIFLPRACLIPMFIPALLCTLLVNGFLVLPQKKEDVQLLKTLLASPLSLLFAILRAALAFHLFIC